MKKTLLLLLVFALWGSSYAHKQHVHQYLTVEAYNLLKMQLGGDLHLMKDRLGGQGSNYIGPGPFQLGYITTGAWREDDEDIVYGYSKSNPPTLTGFSGGVYTFLTAFGGLRPDGFVSSTHFWYADDGDNLQTTMRANCIVLGLDNVISFTIPNAYQKITALANGSYDLNIMLILYGFPTSSDGGGYCATQRAILTFHYNSLIDMYKNKNLYVTKVTWLTGQQTIFNNPIKFLSRHWSLLNNGTYSDFFNTVSFEILGRMCHLVQDMCVPAHANIDPHGDNPGLIDDYYENYFGYDFYWNAQNTYSQVGGFIDPYQSSNPLHYLMYISNQMSNHFATQGPHYKQWNDYFSGNPLPEELSYLNSLSVSGFGSPTSINGPFENTQIMNVRDHMLPQAIRATAGLLYWFAKECNLLPIPITGVSIAGDYELYQGGTGYWNTNVVNGLDPITYQWEIYYFNNNYSLSSKVIRPNLAPPGSWVPCGNNPTFSRSFSSTDLRSFKLRCTVTDGSHTAKVSNEWNVNVINSPPPQSGGSMPSIDYSSYEISEARLPVGFSLEQNYPNPFNPTTKILYSLPEAGLVTLKIYDMLGREVSSLVNENKPAGAFAAEFNASQLPSGTYIYKLSAGNFQMSKKMQVIK